MSTLSTNLVEVYRIPLTWVRGFRPKVLVLMTQFPAMSTHVYPALPVLRPGRGGTQLWYSVSSYHKTALDSFFTEQRQPTSGKDISSTLVHKAQEYFIKTAK